jgi:hypothetical protein
MAGRASALREVHMLHLGSDPGTAPGKCQPEKEQHQAQLKCVFVENEYPRRLAASEVSWLRLFKSILL